MVFYQQQGMGTYITRRGTSSSEYTSCHGEHCAKLLDCRPSGTQSSAHLGAQACGQNQDGHEADLCQHRQHHAVPQHKELVADAQIPVETCETQQSMKNCHSQICQRQAVIPTHLPCGSQQRSANSTTTRDAPVMSTSCVRPSSVPRTAVQKNILRSGTSCRRPQQHLVGQCERASMARPRFHAPGHMMVPSKIPATSKAGN